MIDAFEDRGFLDGGDQPLTNAHASLRPTHGDALNFRHGAIILQHNAGCSDRPVLLCHQSFRELYVRLADRVRNPA
jgi:hypothetical protein